MVRAFWQLYRSAYHGLPVEIWMISIALFVNRFGTMVLPFLALYLNKQLKFSEAETGQLLSVYGVGSILGALLAGRCLSRVGAIRWQIVLLCAAVPVFLILPWLTVAWHIAAGLLVLSVLSEGVRPANAVAVTTFSPKELHVRSFGLQRMAVNLGQSFGPAIGGFLATIGFVWLFVVDAVTTLFGALLLLYFFGFRRYAKPQQVKEALLSGASGRAGSPWRDGGCLAFLGLICLGAIVFFQFMSTYPLYLKDHYRLSEPMIGLIYAVNTLVIVVAEMILLDVVRRWPYLRVITIGAVLSCLGFGMLPFGSSLGYCVLSMLVITAGEMLWMPLASAWVAERSERGERGRYLSTYTMTFSVAALVAPAAGGALYQWLPESVWYACLVAGGVLGAGFWLLHRATDAPGWGAEANAAEGG